MEEKLIRLSAELSKYRLIVYELMENERTFPNDQDLGKEIRKSINNFNNKKQQNDRDAELCRKSKSYLHR